MHSLPIFVRLAGQRVVIIGSGPAADAKRRLVERAGGSCVSEGEGDARIAFVALDGDAADEMASQLRQRGLLVNVVDRPDLCDFTTPAIVDRDPLLIAIATGGASAGLAAALRQRLEAIIPDSIGALVRALGAAREGMRTRWPNGAERRRAIADALSPGGKIDLLSGAGPGDVAAWLDAADAEGGVTGTLLHIVLTSDDPDAMTVRDARALANADIVWHDAAVPVPVLNRARADAERRCATRPPAEPYAGLNIWISTDG